MKIELLKPKSYIYHLRFDTQFDMTSTMLRFGEYYESPEFKGKTFTLASFKKWYMKSQNKKRFTYYEDWHGYNIASKELKPFFEGKFNPLTRSEKQVVELLKDVKGTYYVIATFKRNRLESETLRHEYCHAVYSKEKEYKKAVKEYLKDKDCEELTKFLVKRGYSMSVMTDEINAYLTVDLKWMRKKKLKGPQYTEYSRYLNKLYKKYEVKSV